MVVLELNEDVLSAVCDFLTDVPDILAISLACSSFRPIAIRRLLSIHPVHLNGGASTRRFHVFLFADAPARAPHITALDVETGPCSPFPPQPGDASLLIDIVTSCARLERVTFGCAPSSHRLTEDPGVIDAIASIPSLRSLSISSTAGNALSLVRKVSAPLRKLGLWSYYADDLEEDLEGGFNWYPAAFQDALSHLAPSLEELGFHQLVVDPDKIQELQDSGSPVPSFYGWTQYPAVHSLSVNYFTGRLLLEPLQHLFPALEGTLSVSQIDVEYPEDTLDALRAVNLRAQENVNASGDDGSHAGVWRKLDRVICMAAAFYGLALRCPVRLAILDGTDRYFDAEVVQRCIAVSLRENPVPHLTLCLTLEDGLGVLRGLPPPELGHTLTHLMLVLDTTGYGPPAVPFGWDELLDAMLASLRPLYRLAHLRIVIQSESPVAQNTDTKSDAGASAPAPRSLAEQLSRALHPSTFDFEGTAASLVRPLPSLRSLFLTTCGYFTRREAIGDTTIKLATGKRWCVSRAWRVAAHTGGPSLSVGEGRDEEPTRVHVELRDEEAEVVIQREELVIPDAYKVWFTQHAD